MYQPIYQPGGSSGIDGSPGVIFEGNINVKKHNVNININADVVEGSGTKCGESGCILSFHDIHYTMQYKAGRCRKAEKTILNGVSGVFKPGLNAIMGPTGGGKTTLLDILAARKDTSGLTGKVLIDAKPLPADFRLISGYVVQNDIVMATLTVRENLTFSAALRLPSSVHQKERQQRVEDVIQELGLQDCANSKIGDELIRGISGGEKKRTSVGMELIIKPVILFLDEPTTGLDASTAGSVITLLSQLSQKGRTIILSIHQPRYTIYSLFNRLHLLSRGETAYHGPTTDVLDFFAQNGYVCHEHDNPADFLLDSILLNQAGAANDSSTSVYQDTGPEYVCNFDPSTGNFNYVKDMGYESSTGNEVCKRHLTLNECFKKSDYYSYAATEVDVMYEKFKFEAETKQELKYKTSFPTQLKYVGRRALQNVVRSPLTFKQAFMSILFGLLAGTLYFQLSGKPENAIQDRAGAVFLLTMQTVLFNMNTMNAFIAERVLFLQESRSGYYRTSAFFLAKLFFDLIPQRAFLTLMFITIAYWMIGFNPDFISYLTFVGNFSMTSWCSSALFVFLGSFVDTLVKAFPSFALSLVSMLMFGGFIINIDSIFPWLAWLKYTSIFWYSYNTAMASELSGHVYCNPFPDNSTCVIGDLYLDQQGIDFSRQGLWMNQVAMICIAVGCFTLTYLRLRLLCRLK